MQPLDPRRPWDLSLLQIHVFSNDSPFRGSAEHSPGRVMRRFLPVAVLLCCGGIVRMLEDWADSRSSTIPDRESTVPDTVFSRPERSNCGAEVGDDCTLVD